MSDSSLSEMPAKKRLELNRQALIDQFSARKKPGRGAIQGRVQMVQGRRVAIPEMSAASADHEEDAESVATSGEAPGRAPRSNGGTVSSFLPIAKHMAQTWWEYHPARALLSMGRPFLEDYVERRPWKAVGIAAGVGATLVVVRPWKVLSLGGIIVAAMKSSQVSSIALSLISAAQGSAELARRNVQVSPKAAAPLYEDPALQSATHR